MNAPLIQPDAIERDRRRLIDELEAEDGADWADANRAGSSGCHELLDRTSLIGDLVEERILAHPACLANADWYRLADQAASALRELYQAVGAAHLAEE